MMLSRTRISPSRSFCVFVAICVALALTGCSDNADSSSDTGPHAGDAWDVSTSSDAEGQDADGGCDASADCDQDGLNDCEEEQLGTDVCNADTDDDGLDDGDEEDLGFDPNDPDSLDDGTPDGARWIVDVCDENLPRPTQRVASEDGSWALALNDAWSAGETAVSGTSTITGAWAAVDELPVAAGLVTLDVVDDDMGLVDVEPTVQSAIEGLGTIERQFQGGEFQTHWFASAQKGVFWVETAESTTETAVRNQLYDALSQQSVEDFEPAVPTEPGEQSTRFQIHVTTVMYKTAPDELRPVRVWAVAPSTAAQTVAEVRMTLDDVTNTTALAPSSHSRDDECWRSRSPEVLGLDILVMVDTSAATVAHRDSIASAISDALESSPARYDLRVAVAPLDPQNAVPSRWHRTPDAPLALLDGLFANPPDASRGTEAIRAAVTSMTDGSGTIQFDPEAQAIVVLFSAAEDAGLVGLSEAERESEIESTRQLLEDENVDVRGALGGLTDDCPGVASEAYRTLLNTMSAPQNLCEIGTFFYGAAIAMDTPLTIPFTPISGSVRVFTEGAELPRARFGGWDYVAESNAVQHFREDPPRRGERYFYAVEAQVWSEPEE